MNAKKAKADRRWARALVDKMGEQWIEDAIRRVPTGTLALRRRVALRPLRQALKHAHDGCPDNPCPGVFPYCEALK